MSASSRHDGEPSVERRETNRPEHTSHEPRRPLNVLRIASDLYPDVTGGGAIHAHAMSKQQAKHGHSVTVLTSDHGNSNRPTVETVDGYTVVRHREIASPFGNSITLGILGSFREYLSDADVIHAHSHLYFTSNLAAALRRVSDTPLVVTNHGLLSQTAPKWIQRLFIPTVARFTFNTADRILCYTDTDRHRLRSRNISSSIAVINNGIDCEQFAPSATDLQPQRLLFVGRLTDAKGLPVLLSAFERLADRYPDLELRVVGDGPQRSTYEARCQELGIRDRVTFVGDVPYQEMAKQYRESRVFVLPSHNEGLPRTVLEAMACETPVITTALPQLEQIIEGAGYTINRGSVDELAGRCEQLLTDDSLCKALGQTGRQRVERKHSWAETVQQTTDVYYDLL